MNVKNWMLLLAFTGLAVSCSDDEVVNNTPTIGGRSEIQIEMSGTSESQDYTKAIASESENDIKKLQVYLFASDKQDGTYYYMETWTDGTAYDPKAPQTTNFQKQASGTGWKASIYPNEKVGLPFIKLLCVVNNGSSSTTDGNFYQIDGTTPTEALVAVTTDADGKITNEASATTEDAFRETFTKEMVNGADPADIHDIIATPLLMTGDGQTKIAGSVSKVNITLRRVMARFDIDNTTSKSRLTITSISLANARKNGTLWPANTKLATVADPKTDLMTYAPVPFEGPTANNGVKESAIYVYPALATDECYLVIEGTYKSPVTTNDVSVTYNVPIQKMNGADAEYIDIKANSRYQLSITDVTQAAIYGSFEVVDWTSGGGINIKPENDAPTFDVTKGFSAVAGGTDTDLPKAVDNEDGTKSTTNFKVVDNKSFNITVAATGKVRAEKAAATKADAAPAAPDAWLTIAELTADSYEEKDGIWYTTFTITSTGATGQQPVAVTFINESASYDPALWTTLTFYGPLAAPTLTDATGHSTGNTVDITAKTATMYKVNNSAININAMCIEGVDVEVPKGFVVETGKTEGYTTTYTIKISDASKVTEGAQEIKFKNKEDGTVLTTLTVTLGEPGMTIEKGTDANSAATVSGTDIEVDLDLLSTGNFIFKVNAPQGLTAGSLDCPWLTITESHQWADTDGNKYAEYTVAAKTDPAKNYNDFTITFTNALAGGDNLTVTLKKAASKPKLATATDGTASDFNEEISPVDANTAKVKMYKANDSKIYVKMTCDEAAAFETVGGLTITPTTDDNYEIKVSDATLLTSATTVVTAKNSIDGNRTATLTITWKDPAITVTKTSGTAISETTPLDGTVNIDNTIFTTPATATITMKVSGPKGSTISLSATDKWIAAPGIASEIPEAGTVDITIMSLGATDPSSTEDIILKVTNKVTNGGDKTITFHKN